MGDLSEWQVIVSEMVWGGKSLCHIPSRCCGVDGSLGVGGVAGVLDVTGEREADLPPPPGSGNAPLTSASAQTHPSHRGGGTRISASITALQRCRHRRQHTFPDFLWRVTLSWSHSVRLVSQNS